MPSPCLRVRAPRRARAGRASSHLGEIVGRRSHRVGRRMQQVAPPVAVEVDRVIEIVRREKLKLPKLARERSDHLLGGQITALDDLECGEKLRAEQVGPAAIVGQRGHRLDRRQIAHEAAEVGLQRPERRNHRTGYAKLLLDLLEHRAIFCHALDVVVNTMLCHHAVGEFQEGLREYLLAAVLVHDTLVIDHQMRGRGDRARRDTLRHRLALEVTKPALEACAVVAGRALREGVVVANSAISVAKASVVLLERGNCLHLDQKRLLNQPVDHQ